MMVQYLPLIVNKHRRVPDTAHTIVRALVKPHMREDMTLSTRLLQCAYLLAVDEQALAGESGEVVMVIYRR